MRTLSIVSAALVLALNFVAQAADPVTPPDSASTSFKVGNVPIILPAPDKGFVEIGNDNRPKAEVFCPESNRLIAAFVTPDDLAKIVKSDPTLQMSRYALIEVPKGAELMDCKPADFKEVLTSVDTELANNIDTDFKSAQDEVNRKAKAMNADTIDLGKPVMLGTLFSKPDAKGLGMVTVIKAGDQTRKMAVAIVLARVKQRLLFVYLYSEYKDESPIKWLGETGESWITAVLAANPEQ